ncbi:MAG: adenosylmethionine decarboxylase [Chlorobium sp.]|nr:adenosylmethionine decarboxylase [Chlorobium sp.]
MHSNNNPIQTNSLPDGIHYLLEFFGCNQEQSNSIKFWEQLISQALLNTDLQVLNSHFYQFTPNGITGYFLISASHISIHTWPEHRYLACDIFSCSNESQTETIVNHLRDSFAYDHVKVTKLRRGFKYNGDSDELEKDI